MPSMFLCPLTYPFFANEWPRLHLTHMRGTFSSSRKVTHRNQILKKSLNFIYFFNDWNNLKVNLKIERLNPGVDGHFFAAKTFQLKDIAN